jgi:hypothetical protein
MCIECQRGMEDKGPTTKRRRERRRIERRTVESSAERETVGRRPGPDNFESFPRVNA